MKQFWAALRFLTILPLPEKQGSNKAALAGSVPFFPLVGLLIGLSAAFCVRLGEHLVPTPILAIFLVFGWLAVSGGLHIDGLADTADGFLSSRPREKILDIMGDSRIGTMGVVAIFFVLSLKVVTLTCLTAELLWRAALLAPLAGRCSLVLVMALATSARPEGLLRLFSHKSKLVESLWAISLLCIVNLLVASWLGLILTLVALLAVGMWIIYCRRKIGGITGDTLGALCEIEEMLIPLILVLVTQT